MTKISYLQAIILGLVQGLSEFLPISSSGHLALLQNIFGVHGGSVLLFPVLLHIGTLIAVFAVYWKDLWALIVELIMVFKDLFTGKGLQVRKNPTRKLGFLIIVASIPTAIIGFLFKDVFESFYTSFYAIGVGLLITSVLLFAADKMGGGDKTVGPMMFRNAVFIGIMQGFAIAPGVSRSGSTLFGGLMTKLDREFALKFAFLISVPSILGSAILELPEVASQGLAELPLGPILVGMVVSAVAGFIAIKAMIKLVSNKKLSVFYYYTGILGVIVIIWGVVH